MKKVIAVLSVIIVISVVITGAFVAFSDKEKLKLTDFIKTTTETVGDKKYLSDKEFQALINPSKKMDLSKIHIPGNFFDSIKATSNQREETLNPDELRKYSRKYRCLEPKKTWGEVTPRGQMVVLVTQCETQFTDWNIVITTQIIAPQ